MMITSEYLAVHSFYEWILPNEEELKKLWWFLLHVMNSLLLCDEGIRRIALTQSFRL
jgi:hypothetical protein